MKICIFKVNNWNFIIKYINYDRRDTFVNFINNQGQPT